MFGKLLRSGSVALGSATCALLIGCAAGMAQETHQTVTIGQGGYYTIQIPEPVQNAPYALTGAPTNANQPGVVGVHQNYGQSTLVIAPSPER